jgi:hypothetical protein
VSDKKEWKSLCTCVKYSELRDGYLHFWYKEDPKCPVRHLHGRLPGPHKVKV